MDTVEESAKERNPNIRINELMLGDWVLVNGNAMQIQAVDDIDGEIVADDELYCLVEDRVHSEDKIEPIPLTTEILEKNGFICKGAWMISGEDLGLKQCGDYFKLLPYYYDYNSIGMCDIYYVHELQHALRLCGIDKEIML